MQRTSGSDESFSNDRLRQFRQGSKSDRVRGQQTDHGDKTGKHKQTETLRSEELNLNCCWSDRCRRSLQVPAERTQVYTAKAARDIPVGAAEYQQPKFLDYARCAIEISLWWPKLILKITLLR